MSLPITNITRNSDGTWTFAWTSTGATYYRIVLFGLQLDTTSNAFYTVSDPSALLSYRTFPPPIEVVPTTTKALSELYQPYLLMQWYGDPNATLYLVQYNNGATWQTIAQISNAGQWVLQFQTAVLFDETEYDYRVIAVDALGDQSTPRPYTINVVTPPTPPDAIVTLTYSGPSAHQVQVAHV